jgi:hypothetical protein
VVWFTSAIRWDEYFAEGGDHLESLIEWLLSR